MFEPQVLAEEIEAPTPRNHEDAFRAIEGALDRSRYAEAWNLARKLPDLRTWRGARGRRVGARLASHLGAPRLGEVLERLLWREHPENPIAIIVNTRRLLENGEPLAAWERLEAATPRFADASANRQADYWGLRALILASFRDFERAHTSLERSLALSTEAWHWLYQARCLELEDRLEEAAEAVEESLRRQAWYWPAVQAKVHLLRRRGDDDGALLQLFQASRYCDAPVLFMVLAQLQIDLKFWDDAALSLDHFQQTSPLFELDPKSRIVIDLMRAAIAYRQGRPGAAADLYEGTKLRRLEPLITRLRDATISDCRKTLEVPWVRQNHNTCGPATLTAICRYWNHPAEHLEIAEAICYSGTAAHSERRWAVENGLLARELSVDWKTAVALIDRGIPFTLVTSNASNAHLQAVVGYDDRLETFVCRDPTIRQLVEMDAQALLEGLAATGPRGMILLPPAEAGRLEGLELPDAELYDLYDAVERHLEAHQRQQAAAACRVLGERAPAHRLFHTACRAIAAYDGDLPRQLQALEALCALFPEFAGYRLARLACLRLLGRRAEILTELGRIVAEKETEAPFFFLLAGDLVSDARRHDEAESLLRRGLARSHEAPGYAALAQLATQKGEGHRALEFWRLAACLGEIDESIQWNFFWTSRQKGATTEALAFLERRCLRLGQKSGCPAITLADVLESLDRSAEALAMIEAAVLHRPEDPLLQLDLANRLLRLGRPAEAKAWHQRLERLAEHGPWVELGATFAERDGDLETAFHELEALLKLQPTDFRLCARCVDLLEKSRGAEAALDFLERAHAALPYFKPLSEMLIEHCKAVDPQRARAHLEALLARDAANAWAQRELATALIDEDRFDEAAAALAHAEALEPRAPGLFNTRALLTEARLDVPSTIVCYRQGLEVDPDNLWALVQLGSVGRAPAEHRENLEFLTERVVESIHPATLLAFRDQARRFLAAEELLIQLEDLRRRRPDLWSSWAALADQLVEVGRPEEGAALFEQAKDRFPHQKALWRELANHHFRHNALELGEAALQRLLELDPADVDARYELIGLDLHRERLEAAERQIDRALLRHPRSAGFCAQRAELERRRGRRQEALAAAEQAVEFDPNDFDFWSQLRHLAELAAAPERALAAARRLLERRGDRDAWAYVVLAHLNPDPRAAQEAIDRAIELRPRVATCYLVKVELLKECGDLEGALKACAAGITKVLRPIQLQVEQARLLQQKGQADEALVLLGRALEAQPGFVPGRAQLTEWLADLERWPEVAQSAEEWTRRAPNHSPAWGFLAESHFQRADLEAAAPLFSEALRREPGYGFGAVRLSEIDEKQKGPAAAFAGLEARFALCRSAQVSHRLIELAVRQGGHAHLVRYLEDLALHEDCPFGVAANVVETISRDLPQALPWVDQAAFQGTSAAPLLEARLLRHFEATDFSGAWGLLDRQSGSPLWSRGASFLLRLAVSRRVPGRLVDRQINKNAKDLKRNNETWKQVAEFYLETGRVTLAGGWISDQADRQGLDRRAYELISLTKRCLHQDDLAYQASLRAVTLEPDGSNYHEYWVAFWEAANGRPERALATFSKQPANDRCFNLLRLAEALATVKGRKGDREALARAKRLIFGSAAEAVEPITTDFPVGWRAYNLALKKIAQEIGGFGTWIWSRWKMVPAQGIY